jgi:TLC domain
MSTMSHAEQIRALNSAPLFLPFREHVVGVVVPIVAVTSLSLTALYGICHLVVARHHDALFPSEHDNDKDEDDYENHHSNNNDHHNHHEAERHWGKSSNSNNGEAPSLRDRQQRRRLHRRQRVHKLCYQVTNLSVNAFLGILGIYYQLHYVPPYSAMNVQDTIVGHDPFVVFAAVQLGYQLWSLPVGILHVNESPAMLLHHVAVLMVATMSAFLSGGFRYWTPFFYGIIELSSVPLALMNMFKDRRDWIESYPQLYTAIRLAFCATFLSVRVACFVPRKAMYLRDHYLLWSSALRDPSRPTWYVVFMASVWLSSVFLLGLQLHWGALIARGLVKLVVPKSQSNNKSKSKSQSKSTLDAPPPNSTPLVDAAAATPMINGAHKPKAA